MAFAPPWVFGEHSKAGGLRGYMKTRLKVKMCRINEAPRCSAAEYVCSHRRPASTVSSRGLLFLARSTESALESKLAWEHELQSFKHDLIVLIQQQ